MSSLIISALGIFLTVAPAEAAEVVPLEDFLNQVRANNRTIQFSQLRKDSNRLAKAEPRLVFSPNASVNLVYNDDKPTALPSAAFFTPDKTRSFSQIYAISKNWQWGMETALSHRLSYNSADGLSPAQPNFWSNSLELSASQSLWQNFLGRQDRWRLQSAEESLDAASLREAFKIEQTLVEAERAYWNYALTQELRESLEGSLVRNKRTLSWNEKRRRANLVDRGDVLQSRAAVLKAQDALSDAIKNEKVARRALMFYLGEPMGTEPLPFKTEALPYDAESKFEVMRYSSENRLDLQAQRKRTQAAALQAKVSGDQVLPDLELFATYGGKSIAESFGTSEGETFDNSFREYEVGVALSVPLDFWKTAKVKEAKELLARSQAIEFQESAQATENQLQNLLDELESLREKILFAEELEQVQRSKLSVEEKKFRQGRSSSFQVITFEEDLALAELEKLQLYSKARNLLAELKLYEGEPNL